MISWQIENSTTTVHFIQRLARTCWCQNVCRVLISSLTLSFVILETTTPVFFSATPWMRLKKDRIKSCQHYNLVNKLFAPPLATLTKVNTLEVVWLIHFHWKPLNQLSSQEQLLSRPSLRLLSVKIWSDVHFGYFRNQSSMQDFKTFVFPLHN